MLSLSEILLAEGSEISSFEELKASIQKNAISRGELFFNVDIEPLDTTTAPMIGTIN